MKTNNKVFYNVVIDVDLFYTIYDYLRFNPGTAKDYKVFSTYDFDNLTLEDWKDLAEDAIMWLEFIQLPKICLLDENEGAPSCDTWGTLYYQTLNYMSIKKPGEKALRARTKNEIYTVCVEAIEYLKDKFFEMREPNDDDI